MYLALHGQRFQSEYQMSWFNTIIYFMKLTRKQVIWKNVNAFKEHVVVPRKTCEGVQDTEIIHNLGIYTFVSCEDKSTLVIR